jgi:hypothetical protein
LVFPNSQAATAGIDDLALKIKQIELRWGNDLRVDPLMPDVALRPRLRTAVLGRAACALGIAAVMLASIPVFMALSEIIILRTQKLTLRLALALAIGIGGVAVLVSHSLILGGAPIDGEGAVALIFASMGWSVASVLTRKLSLPPSKVMSSGAQMLAGGVFLALAAAALGEFRNFHPWTVSREAWFALLYLIVAGSIIEFTAYVWLIHHESPTKVGTYAYVNPVVAVLIGYFPGQRRSGPANDPGDSVCSRQRGIDHHDAIEEAGRDTPCRRYGRSWEILI